MVVKGARELTITAKRKKNTSVLILLLKANVVSLTNIILGRCAVVSVVLIFSTLLFQVTYRCGQLIWVVDRHLSWVPFMNFARCAEEQNVEVFLRDGSFFFRTIDRVARGEELLIWPTEGLCRSLKIPILVTPTVNERKTSFLIIQIL